LVGKIDSVNGGIRTTFDTVPDAPVSSSCSRCKAARRLAGKLSQPLQINQPRRCQDRRPNGAKANQRPVLEAPCGNARKKAGPQKKRAAEKASCRQEREGGSMRRTVVVALLALAGVMRWGLALLGAAPSDPLVYKYSFDGSTLPNPIAGASRMVVNHATGNLLVLGGGYVSQFDPPAIPSTSPDGLAADRGSRGLGPRHRQQWWGQPGRLLCLCRRRRLHLLCLPWRRNSRRRQSVPAGS